MGFNFTLVSATTVQFKDTQYANLVWFNKPYTMSNNLICCSYQIEARSKRRQYMVTEFSIINKTQGSTQDTATYNLKKRIYTKKNILNKRRKLSDIR